MVESGPRQHQPIEERHLDAHALAPAPAHGPGRGRPVQQQPVAIAGREHGDDHGRAVADGAHVRDQCRIDDPPDRLAVVAGASGDAMDA